MNDEHRQLWRAGDFECVMISCCSGAELQVRRIGASVGDGGGDGAIVVRELYPLKSDLYERARDLKREYEPDGTAPPASPA